MLNLVDNTFKSSPLIKSDIRYGVVVNIAVSHTAAGGSIPPIGISFSFRSFFLKIFGISVIDYPFSLFSHFPERE